MTELYQAIAEAKKNISPPQKNKKAMYGRYADLEAILEAVEKPLMDQGVMITQCVQDGEHGPVLETRLVHLETGDALESRYPLRAKNLDDPQQFGGSLTYARRYGLTAMLSIVADDDDDGNTSAGKERDGAKKKAPAKKKQEQVTQKDVEEAFPASDGEISEAEVEKLIKGYKRVGFKDAEIVPEIKALTKRDFGQLSSLTQAELKAAMGHARKVKDGTTERLA